MTRSSKQIGQRTTTNRGGAKDRSPTSTSHVGSRVEPSHVTDQNHAERVKTVAKTNAAKSKGKR